jgi:RHH-type proline utilization regulon transcriptional repressor/proline dehydrogenase/delta 1-pyrroline-5-carboxylate dehydrogenase
MELKPLAAAMAAAAVRPWRAAPLIAGEERSGAGTPVLDPSDRRREVGRVVEASAADVEAALIAASAAAGLWDATPAERRAAVLERAAELYEEHGPELMALAVREAGKTLPDAVAELREAVDFCRYYAARARTDFAKPIELPGPTGEKNRLELHGRGVFACISPWNFPLAIFTGQLTAALAAGNAVIAKPAEQTPLIAAAAVRLLHQAGVPAAALNLLPGDGPTVGQPLIADPRIAGVAFTGSTDTARLINLALARRDGPLGTLIAETGGQNAMIVDSSALPEQVVSDAVTSAFQSAGQRCSALRILCLQEDVAERIIAMLAGAIAELEMGDPALLSTDVGPVIDREALQRLEAHVERIAGTGRIIARARPAAHDHGTFLAPVAVEIDRVDRLTGEVFGPVLHVVRYKEDALEPLLDQIVATGYGLTLGIHSRIDETVDRVRQRLGVGNTYVNRNMIGAVVGVQPFGGERLSGTGPKAGGPFYLHRFALERTLSIDTTAAGGNASLLSLTE